MEIREFNDLPLFSLVGDNEWAEEAEEPYYYQQETLLEQELVMSVLDYSTTTEASAFQQTTSSIRTTADKYPTSKTDRDAVGHFTSETYRFFFHVGRAPRTYIMCAPCSPLHFVYFEPFRCLGFAIWDTERMCAYRLLNPDDWPRDDSYFLAWKSVLGAEKMAKVEERNSRLHYYSSRPSDEEDSDDTWS